MKYEEIRQVRTKPVKASPAELSQKRRAIRARLKKFTAEMADTCYSAWYRRYHSDAEGNIACYTCGTIMPWYEGMQLGHYWGKRHYANLRYSEYNVRPQCMRCNRFQEGQKPTMTWNILEEYNFDVDILRYLRTEALTRVTRAHKEYKELCEKYLEMYDACTQPKPEGRQGVEGRLSVIRNLLKAYHDPLRAARVRGSGRDPRHGTADDGDRLRGKWEERRVQSRPPDIWDWESGVRDNRKPKKT